MDRDEHPDFAAGHHALELVAWLAGEEHPASGQIPGCVCPVVGAYVLAPGRRQDDERRTARLRPLLPGLVGSRAVTRVEVAALQARVGDETACRQTFARARALAGKPTEDGSPTDAGALRAIATATQDTWPAVNCVFFPFRPSAEPRHER